MKNRPFDYQLPWCHIVCCCFLLRVLSSVIIIIGVITVFIVFSVLVQLGDGRASQTNSWFRFALVSSLLFSVSSVSSDLTLCVVMFVRQSSALSYIYSSAPITCWLSMTPRTSRWHSSLPSGRHRLRRGVATRVIIWHSIAGAHFTSCWLWELIISHVVQI